VGNPSTDLGIIFIILLFLLFILQKTYPDVIYEFTVITSIQMMKSRELIEETINEQRQKRSERSFRMYQSFKLIRRDYIRKNKVMIEDKSLRLSTKRFIEENYRLSMSRYNINDLPVDDVHDLIKL